MLKKLIKSSKQRAWEEFTAATSCSLLGIICNARWEERKHTYEWNDNMERWKNISSSLLGKTEEGQENREIDSENNSQQEECDGYNHREIQIQKKKMGKIIKFMNKEKKRELFNQTKKKWDQVGGWDRQVRIITRIYKVCRNYTGKHNYKSSLCKDMLGHIKDERGNILMEEDDIMERWLDYF